ncbi:MAG: hypothetical protein OEY11_06615 [Gammaproteobacteria bacterium]|nr:hypothetical protein [Gammaproteobacteria bacterium]
MNKSILLLLSSAFVVTACGGSDKVKTEEYQFADGLRLLEVPPNLTTPEKNLVMEIPLPSLKACEILMEADRKFKAEKAAAEK